MSQKCRFWYKTNLAFSRYLYCNYSNSSLTDCMESNLTVLNL